MRAMEDKGFSKLLSDCRVGIYDFEYIKLLLCGEGHAYTNECSNIFYSLNVCALQKNRKEILLNTLNKYFPNQQKFLLIQYIHMKTAQLFPNMLQKQ